MASGESTKATPRRRGRVPAFMSRKTGGDVVFDFLNVTFLILFVITVVYPFW